MRYHQAPPALDYISDNSEYGVWDGENQVGDTLERVDVGRGHSDLSGISVWDSASSPRRVERQRG